MLNKLIASLESGRIVSEDAAPYGDVEIRTLNPEP
jgi:hypothetical protein